jgi:glycosyltransferase involved in cell wall biosynthesis
VSVLLCVYRGDASDQLRESIESILDQTYTNLELCILVDGPLSAKHETVLEDYSDNERVRLRRQEENRGLASSLNTLIDEIVDEQRCDYVARMDADDIALPMRLVRQVSYLEDNPTIDVLGTGCIEFCEEKDTTRTKTRTLPTDDVTLKRRIVQRTPFIHPTVMFRRSVFDDGIRYRSDNDRSEDTFMWADLTANGYVFANLSEPLLYYRLSRQVIERRRSFGKAVSDMRGRVYMMRRLGKATPLNIAATAAHFGVKLLPASFLERIYRMRS